MKTTINTKLTARLDDKRLRPVKMPQRKPEKVMNEKELLAKVESKIYGNKPKGDMERLRTEVKHRLDDEYSLPKKK